MGMNLPNPSQLTLSYEKGLASQHLSLRDCMTARVYAQGHGRIAATLNMAPSKLTEKLAGVDSSGKTRGVNLDEFEDYLTKTRDVTPIYYLIDKYIRDPAATQQDALAKLASIVDMLPALLSAAGIPTAPAGRGRR